MSAHHFLLQVRHRRLRCGTRDGSVRRRGEPVVLRSSTGSSWPPLLRSHKDRNSRWGRGNTWRKNAICKILVYSWTVSLLDSLQHCQIAFLLFLIRYSWISHRGLAIPRRRTNHHGVLGRPLSQRGWLHSAREADPLRGGIRNTRGVQGGALIVARVFERTFSL